MDELSNRRIMGNRAPRIGHTQTVAWAHGHPWSTGEDDDAIAILFAEDGAVSWVSDAFARVTGWPAKRVLDHNFTELRAKLGLDGDLVALLDNLGAGRPWLGALRLRSRQGSILQIQVRVDPLHDRQGRPVGAIAVAREDQRASKP